MSYLLGIDLGTSAVKVVVCTDDGEVVATESCAYPLHTPRVGWSEQDPEDWWRESARAVRLAIARVAARTGEPAASVGARVRGIGLSGQMHGLVLLPREGGRLRRALRPAILWNDQRTAAQCVQVERAMGGRRALVSACGNAALPGFTLPKLLWVAEHEPDCMARAGLVLLPKDFLRLRLTGEACMDVGDASGTMLLDPVTRRWSPGMLAALRIDAGLLPPVVESGAVAGRLEPDVAKELGLVAGVPVAAGSGDNMAGAVGAGVIEPGQCLATIGTSGVIYTHEAVARLDLGSWDDAACGRVHVFCAGDGTAARPGGYAVTGCTLSAGGALQWLRETFFPGTAYAELLAEAERVPVGCEGLLFLPYLTGERAPHPDPLARGAWVGLTLRHGRGHLVRSVVEGVTFTMGQVLDIQRSMGCRPTRVRLGGGGSANAMWRQMQADVYGVPVARLNAEEGPAFGAALLAGVAVGVWGSVVDACRRTIREVEVIEPRDPGAYEAVKRSHAALYGDLKARFVDLAALV